MGGNVKDLVAYVADKHQEATLRGLLSRRQSLEIRAPTTEIYVSTGHDPDCRRQGPQFLRVFQRQFRFALLMLDHQGSGAESLSALDLEAELQHRLDASGWQDRSTVVVIEPELEAWVWSPSPQVDAVLGWQGRIPSLRQWLSDEGLIGLNDPKPRDPKTALHRALRAVEKRPSAAIYQQLAEKVSLRHCQDRAFQKLWQSLQKWFPSDSSPEAAG